MIDYNELAAEYARHRQVNPPVLRRLLIGGDVKSVSTVLEVGCGTGNYILAFRTSPSVLPGDWIPPSK